MCDEYDEEHMRAFWRAIAVREELAKLEPELEGTGEAVEHPPRGTPQPVREASLRGPLAARPLRSDRPSHKAPLLQTVK